MPRLPAAALLALTLLGLALPAQAAPIVFDFEDGPQGWELTGSAELVQTQLLGGQWAVFGDGFGPWGARLSIDMDLTDITSISMEWFLVNDGVHGPSLLLTCSDEAFSGRCLQLAAFEGVEPGKARVITTDVSRLEGEWRLVLDFSSFYIDPPLTHAVAFVDNITFHPVPEPSSWLLLSLGIAGVVMIRRKVAGRPRS